MSGQFRVVITPKCEREVRKLTSRNSELADVVENLISILEEDPYNHHRRYRIKKLAGVKPGEGQWRIRSGDYRLRYDIVGNDVVLDSFRDRKDAY